jgi:hypothetical protein
MRISTKNERRTTYNVFGLIRGRVEPGKNISEFANEYLLLVPYRCNRRGL